MFKSRFRTGRTVVGLVLACGGVALFARGWTHGERDLHAAELLRNIWLGALAAGVVAAAIGWPRRIPLATSLALPWIGLSLVLPLSIHYVAGVARTNFDEWASISLHFMPATHAALAVLMTLRCRALAAGPVPTGVLSSPAIYGIVTAVGAFPFIISSTYVAMTGIPFIPLLLATNWIAARERTSLPEAQVA